MNVFDIIGPVMIGPSSSHTAGAVRLGRVASKVIDRQQPKKVEITLSGSFARTYRGHGTDRALMAGIMGIDQDLFEAANLDGASSTQVFFKITLPLLMPILVYTVITAMIGGLQMFDVPQVLTNGKGMPDRTSMTLVMYLNNYLGGSKNYGMSGAISVIIFIITGVLSLLVYRTLNKKD
jgi:ABC-type sugar transport system permease subunit